MGRRRNHLHGVARSGGDRAQGRAVVAAARSTHGEHGGRAAWTKDDKELALVHILSSAELDSMTAGVGEDAQPS